MMLSVLVIEGDATVARLLRELFSQQGWDVHVPRDRRGMADALLGGHHFDIITVSYRFPSTNGVEIIKLIREIEHRKRTPVLMVTGGTIAIGEALEAGANEVLYKPIEPHRLIAAVMKSARSTITETCAS